MFYSFVEPNPRFRTSSLFHIHGFAKQRGLYLYVLMCACQARSHDGIHALRLVLCNNGNWGCSWNEPQPSYCPPGSVNQCLSKCNQSQATTSKHLASFLKWGFLDPLLMEETESVVCGAGIFVFTRSSGNFCGPPILRTSTLESFMILIQA